MRAPVSLQWLGPGPRHQNPREIGQLFDNQWAQSPRKSSEGHFCGDPKPKQQRPMGRRFLAVVQYVNPGSDPSGNEQCGGDRSHLASSITLLTIQCGSVVVQPKTSDHLASSPTRGQYVIAQNGHHQPVKGTKQTRENQGEMERHKQRPIGIACMFSKTGRKYPGVWEPSFIGLEIQLQASICSSAIVQCVS